VNLVLVDSGGANIGSVRYALQRLGVESRLSADPAEIRAADRVILPGVGAAGPGMARLRELDLVDTLRGLRQPLLGICLGMQLLFESSTEHEGAQGLGILPGSVTALESPRLPHIGWNLVRFERPSALTEGLGEAAAFYHVHSFACRPSDASDVVGTSEYGERFVSVVERGNVMAAQFHPEKSSRDGLRMLRNFAQLAKVAVA
jgi:glutamine amidotransferase